MAYTVLIDLPATVEAAKVEKLIIENFAIPEKEIKVLYTEQIKIKKASHKHAKYHEELKCITNVNAQLDARSFGNRMNFY